MSKPVIIACTGGIGSGKSYVVKAFSCMGIPSYDCDSRAKQLYYEDKNLLAKVVEIVGEDILIDGRLNKKAFAEKIFNNNNLLDAVESVVHPAVLRDFSSWCSCQNSKLIIFESAIYLEKPGLNNLADFVIVVTAPQEQRIERVMLRDGLPREAVLARIESQWTDRQRIDKADYIIETNDRDAIIPQLISIIHKWQQI